MPYPPFQRRLNAALDRIQSRLRRDRPASVLILVIALLVLMALLATAFISTASNERYSSTQNTYNTEVDLLVQGVLNMAQGPMLRKIQSTQGTFRPAVSASLQYTLDQYVPWECPATDTYLAGRIPLLYPNTAIPYWDYITAPINGTTFEAPYAVDAASGTVLPAPLQYNIRSNANPTSISVPQADGTTKIYPALTITDPTNTINSGKPFTVLAADTDGDGIADAGLIRLPIGQLEGATYYGAVRIVDNSAAINASIAIEANPDTATGRAVPGDLFPVNLDLNGLLNSNDVAANPPGLTLLNEFRFNNGAANTGKAFTANPVSDPAAGTTGKSHTELVFNTPYEAFWTQLGSRLNNPGYNTTTLKYQALSIDEGLSLAYHGGNQANPNTYPSPVLDTDLPYSMGSTALRTAAYAPNAVTNWYNQTFNYNTNGTTGTLPLRPLLVVRNPVSNFVPSYFTDQGFYNKTFAYNFGDRVQSGDPITGQLRGFVCVCPNVGNPPVNANNTYNPFFWAPMPWTNHPTKINVNTATFDQLWTAYWSVMQDSPDAANNYPGGNAQVDFDPGTLPPTNTLTHQFRSPIRPGLGSATALSRTQVIQLRAALAAVNTIDMRDGDEDVTSRTIALTAANGNVIYADVYGAEKQPYITELMIDFDPSKTPTAQWVAVEIYNPHPTPIPLTNWKLASLNRSSMTLTEIGDFNTSLKTYTHPNGQIGAFIYPGERLVLQNTIPTPQRSSNDVAADWAKRSIKPITNMALTGGGNLQNAIGQELVLLRPRQSSNKGGTSAGTTTPTAPATGALTSNATLALQVSQNYFNEGTVAASNLSEFVPLDNIDLAGITVPQPSPPAPAPPTPPARYRYARANAITATNASLAWHCVYPGPYVAGAVAGSFRTWGLCAVDGASMMPDDGYFGAAKQKFTGQQPSTQTSNMLSQYATYETRPLQINNRDSAGPNKVYGENYVTFKAQSIASGAVTVAQSSDANSTYWPMSFPYGGFARDGDILQVPFIGAYKLFSPNGQILEMNSVTIDSVMAQFVDPSWNSIQNNVAYEADMDSTYGVPFHNEQIGHFCPMDIGTYNDFTDNPTVQANLLASIPYWKYHWAKRLFDYLAVSTPQDAYLPNIDPAVTSAGLSGDPTLPGSAYKYPVATTVTGAATLAPQAVPTAAGLTYAGQANQGFQGLQDSAAVEGRINVNSASWKALSAVPFYTPGESGATYKQGNATLAQQIVQWRAPAAWVSGTSYTVGNVVSYSGTIYQNVLATSSNVNPATDTMHWQYQPNAGQPFRSLFDLMSVPQFKAMNQYWTNSVPGQAINQLGDLSPFAATMPPSSSVAWYGTKGVAGTLYLTTPSETDTVDHVFGDVKTRFIALQRISNLLTTRSDSFTAYALVQGWQNVGTLPNLVATRHAAVLLDRSQVLPQHNATTGAVTLTPIGVTNVPND